MGELLAVTCDSCGEPMVPNVSTLDDDGCGWICLSPGCPELAAGELEAEDLVEAGVPEALAGRLARLVDHYVDAEEARGREADAPARARERAQADLARLHALLLELGRLAEGAGALAAHLSDTLVVSYHSGRLRRGPGSPPGARRRRRPLRRPAPHRRRRPGPARRRRLRAAGAAHRSGAVRGRRGQPAWRRRRALACGRVVMLRTFAPLGHAFVVGDSVPERRSASVGSAISRRMSLSAVALWNTVPFSQRTTVLGPVPSSFSNFACVRDVRRSRLRGRQQAAPSRACAARAGVGRQRRHPDRPLHSGAATVLDAVARRPSHPGGRSRCSRPTPPPGCRTRRTSSGTPRPPSGPQWTAPVPAARPDVHHDLVVRPRRTSRTSLRRRTRPRTRSATSPFLSTAEPIQLPCASMQVSTSIMVSTAS